MGIFSRLADIVNSNINAILDRAEDPEKIIRLIIQEMEDTLVEVRSRRCGPSPSEGDGAPRSRRCGASATNGSAAPSSALTKGREDLAKGALCAKARARRRARGATEADRAGRRRRSTSRTTTSPSFRPSSPTPRRARRRSCARQKTAGARLKLRTNLYDERIDRRLCPLRARSSARSTRSRARSRRSISAGKTTLADEFVGHREGRRRRRGGAQALEGAARQPHQAGTANDRPHAMHRRVRSSSSASSS